MNNEKRNRMMKKDRLFQYAYDNGVHCPGFCDLYSTKIVENTDLITEKEANDLWDKYYDEVVKKYQNDERPQMCIWKDCNSNTDYSEIEKEIDYRDDLEVKNGEFYKKH